jgi:hypothetical protein
LGRLRALRYLILVIGKITIPTPERSGAEEARIKNGNRKKFKSEPRTPRAFGEHAPG